MYEKYIYIDYIRFGQTHYVSEKMLYAKDIKKCIKIL